MYRLALVCDFLEEKWLSMDLVGDMLYEKLRDRHGATLKSEQLRPTMRRRCSAIPKFGRGRLAVNADRLINRTYDYAHWLRRHRDRFDLFHIVDHSYAHLVFEAQPERTVVTCHDLDAFQCITEPQKEPRPFWFRRVTRRILRGLQAAAHVVFVSETVRQTAIKQGIVAANKTSVVHNGSRYHTPPSLAAERKVIKLLAQSAESPLLLHVGSTVPRKRIEFLLQVFAAVRARIPNAKLVRAGGPFTPEQAALARELGVSPHIVQLPYLDAELLGAVYRQSTFLLQPSSSEGFGLPVIEAMASGCPVIASRIPVFEEIGGKAAVYCEIDDRQSWVQTIYELLTMRTANSAAWSQKVEASLANAGRFTWERTADQMASIYEGLLSS